VDELQDRLVRVGLATLTEHRFALAGGYALQAHGLIDRLSEDVDLFTDRWDTAAFSRAVDSVVEAYRREGLDVIVARRAETFARLEATDPASGRAGAVDLAADVRRDEPVALTIGLVLAESDAVASKVAAVFSRGYARDYLDLAGILASGRYNRDQLMAMAKAVDAGFTIGWFAEALAGVDRFSDDQFTRYGVAPCEIAAVRETMRSWSAELADRATSAQPPLAADRAAGRGVPTTTRTPEPAPHATPDSGYRPPSPEGPSL
jgi:hypothetical protein